MFRSSSSCVTVGRSGCDLNLNEPGVWDGHFTLRVGEDFRWRLFCRGDATVRIRGTVLAESPLRIGDIIDCGSVRLEFDFAKPEVATFRDWAISLWLGIALLTGAEIWLALKWPGAS